jgi:hypothetical protein
MNAFDLIAIACILLNNNHQSLVPFIIKNSCGDFDCQYESGIAGDHISWTFEENTLTFSGYGKMSNDNSFSYLSNNVFHVVFEGDITTISSDAFFHFTSLQTVKLPVNINSIGDRAFFYTNISQLMIPKGCQSIGESAFAFTTMRAISIPDTVKEIGEYAFGITPKPEEPLPYAYSSVHTAIISETDSFAEKYAIEHELSFYEYGDINQDGMLSQEDVLLMQQGLSGFTKMMIPMDLNGDMVINAIDLSILKQKVISYNEKEKFK